jgi:Zn-dependent protease/predicted transcriptional regulator
MFTKSGFRIGKIFGIPIYLDVSWLFIFALITYSLAMSFQKQFSWLSETQQWLLGGAASLLFFGSILFHELAHSVVAQHYKIKVVSITLFLFGGVARIGREPSKSIQEFNIAVAGPLASFLLGGFFVGLPLLFPTHEIVKGVSAFLSGINLYLGAFNLAPGFPLDGGRILRAIVWGITKDFSRATRVAGTTGKLIAYCIIAVGGYFVFQGQWQSGIWPIILGFFLLNAAQESVAQIAIQETLAGLHAADIMSSEVPTINRNTSLEEYGAEVLRTGRRFHLVITDDRLVGLMNLHALNSVPRDEWMENSVQAVMIPREKILWASPEEPLLRLLERLLAADINQMPVVTESENDGSHIVGLVTRDSILRVMQTRAEIGPLPSTK